MYVFACVPPGTGHRVQVTAQGYEPGSMSGLAVDHEQVVVPMLALKAGTDPGDNGDPPRPPRSGGCAGTVDVSGGGGGMSGAGVLTLVAALALVALSARRFGQV